MVYEGLYYGTLDRNRPDFKEGKTPILDIDVQVLSLKRV